MTCRGLLVHGLKRLRMVVTSVTAVATGLYNIASRREHSNRVQLAPGDEAPDFRLQASDGRTYRLSEFRGRQAVVIAWFPKAFTGGCTVECQSIGSSARRLRQLGVACFAASVDTLETNRRFAASLGIDVPILSDPQKVEARAYGVLERHGFPSRWTFHIGVDGRIQAIDKAVRVGSHGSDIERVLGEWPGHFSSHLMNSSQGREDTKHTDE